MKPFVGPPTSADPAAAGCAYSAHLDQPPCGQPVTVHVIGRAEGWGWVGLNTCDDHLETAKAGCVEIANVHTAADCDGNHYAEGTA